MCKLFTLLYNSTIGKAKTCQGNNFLYLILETIPFKKTQPKMERGFITGISLTIP